MVAIGTKLTLSAFASKADIDGRVASISSSVIYPKRSCGGRAAMRTALLSQLHVLRLGERAAPSVNCDSGEKAQAHENA
jgi:hypothetical protein